MKETEDKMFSSDVRNGNDGNKEVKDVGEIPDVLSGHDYLVQVIKDVAGFPQTKRKK